MFPAAEGGIPRPQAARMSTESVPHCSHTPRCSEPSNTPYLKIQSTTGKTGWFPRQGSKDNPRWGGAHTETRDIAGGPPKIISSFLRSPTDFSQNYTKVAQKYSKNKIRLTILAHYIPSQILWPFPARVRRKQFQIKIAHKNS